jgi:hypothetical protein
MPGEDQLRARMTRLQNEGRRHRFRRLLRFTWDGGGHVTPIQVPREHVALMGICRALREQCGRGAHDRPELHHELMESSFLAAIVSHEDPLRG